MLIRKILQIFAVALLVSAMTILPAAASSPSAKLNGGGGSVDREYGTANRWWATSAQKGVCRGHTSQDWIVYYSTNNNTWRRADIAKVRWWSGYVPLLATTPSAQVEVNALSSGGGLKLCLHGTFSKSAVMNSWVWLKP